MSPGPRRAQLHDIGGRSVTLLFDGPADQPTVMGVASAQKRDYDIAFIRQLLEKQSDKPPWKDVDLQSHVLKTLWRKWERLAMCEDLCRK